MEEKTKDGRTYQNFTVAAEAVMGAATTRRTRMTEPHQPEVASATMICVIPAAPPPHRQPVAAADLRPPSAVPSAPCATGPPHTELAQMGHAPRLPPRAAGVLFSGDTAAGRSFAALADRQRHAVLSRLGHLIRNVAPVFLLCDVRDLGVAQRVRDPDLGVPALYLYDAYPGGSGLAEGFRDCGFFRMER